MVCRTGNIQTQNRVQVEPTLTHTAVFIRRYIPLAHVLRIVKKMLYGIHCN